MQGRFEHDKSVIDHAYRLVKEYEEHEREQDALWKEKHGNEETLESPDR